MVLAPLIVLGLAPPVLFQQQLLFAVTIALLGFAGMMIKDRRVASLSSIGLLALIVWGKIADDIYRLTSPDSAFLLLEFMVIIFMMEASNIAISFDITYEALRTMEDSISADHRIRLIKWSRNMLVALGRLFTASFGLTLGLVIIGGLIGVSINQIAFSGLLVMIAVIALVVLVIYGREPALTRRDRD